jgi:hypothetical protein
MQAPVIAATSPAQISGFVTLCVLVVASVQYDDFCPRNPWISITVIAPSPTINPAIKRNSPSISSQGTGPAAAAEKAEKTVSIMILIPF